MSINFDRTRLALLLVLFALLGIGIWAYRGVGDSLREIRATGMQTLLNTQVGTLGQWIAERRREAEQLAAAPELSAAIDRLAADGEGDRARVVAGFSARPRPWALPRRWSSIRAAGCSPPAMPGAQVAM
ncbi:MAG: hypothetical protein IPK39_05010 [Sulfuritalea sp.]|nr:hypothetical protein [Sulfuritalea sp.]